ncbi:SRPBCC domain-containing protein [Mucilaginibacter sp. SMC90]|uniref:SRPBCC family protein n=1 Tax=Mucilaginibacter sp. SMC90 TaxID=2929803 RepID=UPI001FB2AAE3|nr:SRPBCC domain-containing protein [Mucilaginibacter sp. SMC90]UOE47191.1 SRPBCC domain-containing protein [Mucilaginibacter sp. SMC90]
MAKIIQHQLFYPHPPEVVWEYLTDQELVSQWLMPGDLKPIPGHEFQLKAKPMPEMDFDGIFYCKILEVIPFKKLSYSWKFGPGNGELSDSTVNWLLTEKDNGTELLLEHRDFTGPENLLMFASMKEGWLVLINKMLQVINAGKHGTKQA